MTAAPITYGGQAVIEGVVIRGRRTLALACRRPNGEIYRYREPLDSPLQRSRVARLPFVRGVVVLSESLVHGLRMLMRSADVQLESEGRPRDPRGNVAGLALAVVVALALFIGLPYLATQALGRALPSSALLNVLEGLARLAVLLAYLVAIAALPDIRRVFGYHGAEHMAIHAFERGEPLDVARVAPYPTAHPRCGTAFLLLVVLVAIVLFAFVPRTNPLVDLAARLALVLPVAAVSYEGLRFGARHERNPFVALIVLPGLALQRLTTRRPDERMIEVAIASLEEALAGDRQAEAA